MPNILLKTSSKEGNNEWALIELQGDLKSNSEILDGQFIGDLFYTKSGTPTLIIGHHLLYGKEVTLEKPFALLEKKTSETTDGNVTEYVVKNVIKKSLIFKLRPKPIVK